MLVPHRAVLFQPFLEPPQLVLHLFNRPIQGRKYSPGLLNSYKFIMVLSSHAELQAGTLAMLDIHGDGNGRQTVEELPQKVNFLGDLLLGCGAQVPMPGGNGRLHRCFSKADRPLARYQMAAAVSAVGETLYSSQFLISRERAGIRTFGRAGLVFLVIFSVGLGL